MTKHPMIVRCGFHHTFGWLRRSELDNRDGYCYEAPDGDLIYSAMFHHDKGMVLYELIDAETGEHYLVDQVGDGTY
jgi:hypothetical protein